MSTVTIAAAQTCPVKGDIEANVRNHVAMVGRAADAGADLVLFPELSITGYEKELAASLAVTSDDVRLARLRERAEKLGVVVVAGAPVVCPGGKPFIGAIVYGAGEPVVYRKWFVHESEEAYFSFGDCGCVVEVKGQRVAMAICADVTHAEHAQDAANRGADIYASGVFVTPEGYERDARMLEGYAAKHSMAVLLANYGGPTGGLASAGRSAIWDDKGRQVAVAGECGEALVVARCEPGEWSD